MANAVTVQTIVDGPRNSVIKVVGVLDTSDVAYAAIIDPATLVGIDNTGALKAATFRVKGLTYSVQDLLEVRLWWDATTPILMEALAGRGTMPNAIAEYGGLVNNALNPTPQPGVTGKIGLSTQGWVGVLSFTLILELVKVQSGVTANVAGVVGPTVSQGYANIAGTIPTR